MIKEKFDAFFLAFLSQHFQNIFSIGRTLYDVVVGNFAVPHGKTIVMFAGDGNVFHAGAFAIWTQLWDQIQSD